MHLDNESSTVPKANSPRADPILSIQRLYSSPLLTDSEEVPARCPSACGSPGASSGSGSVPSRFPAQPELPGPPPPRVCKQVRTSASSRRWLRPAPAGLSQAWMLRELSRPFQFRPQPRGSQPAFCLSH